jgi:hypothetical protein
MNCIPKKNAQALLGAAFLTFALGSASAAAPNANPNASSNAGSTAACSCFNPSTLNQIYSSELGLSPKQASSRHCAIAPTFLDMEQSVISTRVVRVAPDQSFAPNVVNTEPEVRVDSQFLIYIDSNPNKPMGSCEIKTIRGAVTKRYVKLEIPHQEAAACMDEIQTSKAWQELCVGDVLKSE